MLPAFFEYARNNHQSFKKEYISSNIRSLFANHGMEPRDLFYKDSDYIKAFGNNPFAAETPITLLAKDWSNKLLSLSSGNFDPLA